MIRLKIIAFLLRGISMGSKFLLIIGLSKQLSIKEYGTFSLIITTITFLMFFLGLDFYNFSHREIIDNHNKKIQLIVNQVWFHLLCYIIYFPLVYIIFLNDIIPIKYFFIFYILLFLEHFGQELFRFFNLFNKPNQANFILFLRTAFWIVPFVLIEFLFLNKELHIENVLYYWIGGSSIALIYSIYYAIFIKKIDLKNVSFFKVDKSWIKKGIKISIPFFLGTIAYKIIEYSDRYMIDWYLGKEQVGIYSFYANFANIVNVVVNTITITIMLPNILRAVSSKNKNEIKIRIKQFKKELYFITFCVSVFLVISIHPTLNWQKKPEITSEILVFYIIVISNVLFNISLYYHFLLYAYKEDKAIMKPAIFASILNIVINIIFIPTFGIIAASISTLFSFALILVLKKVYWTNFKKINIEK